MCVFPALIRSHATRRVSWKIVYTDPGHGCYFSYRLKKPQSELVRPVRRWTILKGFPFFQSGNETPPIFCENVRDVTCISEYSYCCRPSSRTWPGSAPRGWAHWHRCCCEAAHLLATWPVACCCCRWQLPVARLGAATTSPRNSR